MLLVKVGFIELSLDQRRMKKSTVIFFFSSVLLSNYEINYSGVEYFTDCITDQDFAEKTFSLANVDFFIKFSGWERGSF